MVQVIQIGSPGFERREDPIGEALAVEGTGFGNDHTASFRPGVTRRRECPGKGGGGCRRDPLKRGHPDGTGNRGSPC